MDNGLTLLETKDVENLAGYGLSAVIKNKRILLGNEKLLRNNKVKITHSADTKALAASGNSLVYMAIDGSHVATFGVKDIIREEAKDVVSSLKDQGLRVVMLSGDRQEVAESIGSALGIDEIVAEILPSDKAKFIRKLQSEGNIVMMCGDGINDSPALASANIGVSVQGGTSIAIDSADIILLKDNLSKILDLLKISKYTIRNIKQNLFWAFFYNSLMIPIALGALRFANILINPMIASACMMVSSLSVVFNALRLKLIKVNKER